MFKRLINKGMLPGVGVIAFGAIVLLAGGLLAQVGASNTYFPMAIPTGGCTIPNDLSGRAFVADFTGNGRADFADVTNTQTCVTLSTGTAFGNLTLWQSLPFYGTKATLAGNVTGGSTGAALVAVNSGGTFVMTSNGTTGFNAPTQWSSTPFYGTIGTYLADVNGDGKADLVAVNNTSVFVMLSTGTAFAAPTQWSSTAFFGNVATLVGAVNGGPAALIALNLTSTWLMTSNGSTAFNAPVQGSNMPFYGNNTTLVGDLTGNTHADLIAVNFSSQWALLSNGASGFAAPAQWSNTPFYGTNATLAGDVTGSAGGRNDLVAVNASTGSIFVEPSTGTGFGAVSRWF